MPKQGSRAKTLKPVRPLPGRPLIAPPSCSHHHTVSGELCALVQKCVFLCVSVGVGDGKVMQLCEAVMA